MKVNLAGLLSNLSAGPTVDPNLEERNQITRAIEKAHREWIAARTYFQTVSDPELVDHAIFLVDAAEKKYMYLMRRAREHGFTASMASGHNQGKVSV